MKYFVVDTTIFDGEYEYLSQSPIEAETEEEALSLAERDAEDWTGDDYREYKVTMRAEISAEEFNVINRYIY